MIYAPTFYFSKNERFMVDSAEKHANTDRDS